MERHETSTKRGCFGYSRSVRGGTLFGLQFQGDGTDLYALPTVDPTLGKSLVQDALPLEYERNPIAIGTTGMRRFRKVGTPALGRDGPAPGEGRDTSKYYNLVPSMPSQPADADAAQSIELDAQTGDVVVEETPTNSVEFRGAHGAHWGAWGPMGPMGPMPVRKL